MNTYPTSYESAGLRYASYVRASSLHVAAKRIALRGIGERFDSRSPGDKQSRCGAYELFTAGKTIECAYWLCFAGNVLCNAGLWARGNLLDDSGLIHLVLHAASYTKKNRKKYAEFVASEREVTLMLLREFDRRTERLGY